MSHLILATHYKWLFRHYISLPIWRLFQVMREGSSDVLNKLYDTALNKLEAMKNDYEALRKRYNEKTAGHNVDLSRLDQAEEENLRLQKQLDLLLKQRDVAIHYQQQYSSSLRR